MTTLTEAARAFPAEHAFRHRMRHGGRESLAHMLMFPEQGIAGFIYPTVLEDGYAKGRATLFGSSLPEPIHEQVDEQVAATLNFDDWRTGPLHMSVREAHQRVDLSWDGARIKFHGQFEALHPPYAFSLHPEGNPPYYGDDRTEQHGRIVADLVIDGRAAKAEGFLVRDHSWGPRIWGLNQHYKWFHAVNAQCSIHFFEMQSFGRRQLRGFLWRDGRMEHIASLDCDYRFDDQMMQQTLRATVVDAAGRVANIECQAFATIQLEFDPMIYLNEAAMTLEIDGRPGVGWCEFCWNRDYFKFAQKFVAQYG
ncbi:MAG: DUF7064 domain-containing protein [Panacagrimonas sp.]